MLPSAKSLGLFKKLSNSETSDKNDDHKKQENDLPMCKRMKIFPSIRNQFVVHIYYALKDNEIIQDIIDDLENQSANVIFENEPHISFIYGHYAVQYHQIEPLIDQLSDLIKSFETFSLCLNEVKVLPNYNNSRLFIAICESKRTNNLGNIKPINTSRCLIRSIHSILRQYRSELFLVDQDKIDSFIFHTSVASYTAENQNEADEVINNINNYFNEQVLLVKINQINIKVGHISRIINLI